MKVGLRELYFQLVGQDSVWYVAMYIQTSARLKNGSWEVHTGVSGRKMPEQSNLAGCSFTLAWDHFSFKILPHTPSFCKSCRWDGLLVLDLWISCLTWPFIKLLQQGAKRRRGPQHHFYSLSAWMFNHQVILPQWPELGQRWWLPEKFRGAKQLLSP